MTESSRDWYAVGDGVSPAAVTLPAALLWLPEWGNK